MQSSVLIQLAETLSLAPRRFMIRPNSSPNSEVDHPSLGIDHVKPPSSSSTKIVLYYLS